MERRLTAIPAADAVGAWRPIGADEEGALAALEALRRGIIDPIIVAHNGRVVTLMGDGPWAGFGWRRRCRSRRSGGLATRAPSGMIR